MSRLETILQLAKVAMMALFLAILLWLLAQGKVVISFG
jgi:hypothetical protein